MISGRGFRSFVAVLSIVIAAEMVFESTCRCYPRTLGILPALTRPDFALFQPSYLVILPLVLVPFCALPALIGALGLRGLTLGRIRLRAAFTWLFGLLYLGLGGMLTIVIAATAP